MVNPGSPLVTVMDVSRVVARVNLGQDQAKNIKVGAEATVTPADGGELVPAKVTIVSPATDANSTTIQVWVEADNAEGHMRAGESVHVSIVAATVDGATVIPTAAVLPNDEGETIVLIVDDKNIAHEKVVQVGLREPDMVQIIAGLDVGQRVISSGGLGLEDKSKVRIMKPGEKKPGEKDEADDDK
jgi:RND family efflux transporter MFP subunit